jgi:hypothetical protein
LLRLKSKAKIILKEKKKGCAFVQSATHTTPQVRKTNMEDKTITANISSRAVTPIKIKVKLRKTQFLGFNQWKCNIHGEDRIVSMQWVEWYCMSIEDAISSFKQYQVEEFTIKGQFS